jgi:hypothetical protein
MFLMVLASSVTARAEDCEELPGFGQVRERLMTVHAGEVPSEAAVWSEGERSVLACIAASTDEIVVLRRRARQLLATLEPTGSCELRVRPYFSPTTAYSLTETLDAMGALVPCFGEAGRWLLLREALFGAGPRARNAWRLLLSP